MIQKSLHQNYCAKSEKISQWYSEKTKGLGLPLYSSYDIRDSGFKVANVDANIFPAGFNNICPTDKDFAIEIFSKALGSRYDFPVERIMLVTEEHTNNPYYWENVLTIKSLIESGGRKVLIAIPQRLENPLKVKSISGLEIDVVSAFNDSKWVKEFKPQLIVSNNDFSEPYEEWAKQLNLPVDPPRELGWYQRKKSNYFKHYNALVEEFSALCGIDPFVLNVKTEIFENFDLSDEGQMKILAEKVDKMLASLREEYKKRGIDSKPNVFIKNNAGTYGLGVTQVSSGADVMEWNYKSRKKMKAAKGGREIHDVIVQEGIPSRVQSDGATAEPVIYMVGCDLTGGFLRTHAEKSVNESLNSPGAVYKRLCVSDLQVNVEGSPLENVYGWSARLGLLAIGLEAKDVGLRLRGPGCGG
jgi:glutamate--cysteine ligase